jgi:hypothetical protein
MTIVLEGAQVALFLVGVALGLTLLVWLLRQTFR